MGLAAAGDRGGQADQRAHPLAPLQAQVPDGLAEGDVVGVREVSDGGLDGLRPAVPEGPEAGPVGPRLDRLGARLGGRVGQPRRGVSAEPGLGGDLGQDLLEQGDGAAVGERRERGRRLGPGDRDRVGRQRPIGEADGRQRAGPGALVQRPLGALPREPQPGDVAVEAGVHVVGHVAGDDPRRNRAAQEQHRLGDRVVAGPLAVEQPVEHPSDEHPVPLEEVRPDAAEPAHVALEQRRPLRLVGGSGPDALVPGLHRHDGEVTRLAAPPAAAEAPRDVHHEGAAEAGPGHGPGVIGAADLVERGRDRRKHRLHQPAIPTLVQIARSPHPRSSRAADPKAWGAIGSRIDCVA